MADYPNKCDLCGYMIESDDDRIWWHGYGNCVEITDEMMAEWNKLAGDTRAGKR